MENHLRPYTNHIPDMQGISLHTIQPNKRIHCLPKQEQIKLPISWCIIMRSRRYMYNANVWVIARLGLRMACSPMQPYRSLRCVYSVTDSWEHGGVLHARIQTKMIRGGGGVQLSSDKALLLMRGERIKIPLKADHPWPASETQYKWASNIECWLGSFVIYPIFFWFSRVGVVRASCPPLYLHMSRRLGGSVS